MLRYVALVGIISERIVCKLHHNSPKTTLDDNEKQK